jgi:ferritin
MTRLEKAKEELENKWCKLFYADGHEVQIREKDKILAKETMDDCNNDDEVAEFVEWFVNEQC